MTSITRASTRTVTLAITGMTCTSCEHRVRTRLRKVGGVTAVNVNARRGIATLTVTDAVDIEEVTAALAGSGYGVGRCSWISRDAAVWARAGLAAVIVAAAAVALTAAGVGRLTDSLGADGAPGLAMIALVGLVAGVSTCMAMVGGVVLGLAASSPVPTATGRWARLRPHVAFHIGRIGGFFLGGAALGALGAQVVLPALAQGLLMAAIALVMATLGIRLTGLSPRLAAWTPSLPASWGRRRNTAGKPYSDLRAVAAGAATFVLPCGFTQAVQLYALSTGSPLQAGLTMAVFALGTAPGLLGLAGLGSAATRRGTATVSATVGVLLLVFSALNLVGALNVAGVAAPTGTTAAPTRHALSANVTRTGTSQTVTMTQDDAGYTPAATYVAAGVPIIWTITSTSPYSCAAFLRAPSMGVQANLQGGVNTVTVGALQPGTYRFTCVMGMYSGTIVAVDGS